MQQKNANNKSNNGVNKRRRAKRNVPQELKQLVAGKQRFKCNNKPYSDNRGLEFYECVLWRLIGPDQGCFDESGYEIDHILEHSLCEDDSENNLQALCRLCHTVKTRRYNVLLQQLE